MSFTGSPLSNPAASSATSPGAVKASKKSGLFKSLGGKSLGPILNVGFGTLTAVSGYEDMRARGVNPVIAAAGGIASGLIQQEFWLPLAAIQIAKAAPLVNQQIQNQIGSIQRNLMPMNGTRFVDSEYAQTSRQRALEAINNSRMNARSYIGNESQLFATRYK